MNKLRTILVFGAAAVLGVGAGVIFRKSHSRSEAQTNQPPIPPAANFGNAKPHLTHGAPADDSPLATKLAQDLTISKGVKTWLLWLEAMEKAGPADFPRLVRLAQSNPAALRFVAARWVEIAPRHLYDTLVAAVRSGSSGFPLREVSQALFDQWPKKDPEAAIAALNEPGDLGPRALWRGQVADSVIRTDAERGLRLMAEWHIENYGPSMSAVTKWATADPQHAAEFTLQNGLGHAAAYAMEAIGKEWAKSDPSAALSFGAANPGHLGNALQNAVLKQWASRDLDAAGDWLAQTDARTRNHLSPALMETWAKKDPIAAMSWCDENLTGSGLSQAVSGVVKGVAEKDIVRASDLVAQMQPGAARAEAAATVANQWMPGLSSDKPVAPEMISWLSALDPDSCRRALYGIVWSWATTDAKSMATFVGQASSDRIPEYTDSVIARQMARKTPVQALDWAATLPDGRGLTAGATAFAEWRGWQSETAMKWLDDLPANDPRREPFFQKAIETLAWHPQASEQLGAMSDADRAAALKVIKGLDMPEDRRARLLAGVPTAKPQ